MKCSCSFRQWWALVCCLTLWQFWTFRLWGFGGIILVVFFEVLEMSFGECRLSFSSWTAIAWLWQKSPSKIKWISCKCGAHCKWSFKCLGISCCSRYTVQVKGIAKKKLRSASWKAGLLCIVTYWPRLGSNLEHMHMMCNLPVLFCFS